jgi:hypothetical protein
LSRKRQAEDEELECGEERFHDGKRLGMDRGLDRVVGCELYLTYNTLSINSVKEASK